MSRQKQDKLQNGVYVLKHIVLEYGKQLAEKDPKNHTNVVEIVYNALLQMREQSDKGNNAKRLREAFKAVPLQYHVQAFKSIITNFYISNHIDGKVMNSSEGTNAVVAELMNTTDLFYQETGKVLSPFESLLLTLKALLKDSNLRKPEYHKEAELFVGNIQAQKRILEDFLTQYDKKYSQIIKEEDSIND